MFVRDTCSKHFNVRQPNKIHLSLQQANVRPAPLTCISTRSKLQDMTTLDVQQQNAIYADYNRQHPELQQVITTVASCNCNCRILQRVRPVPRHPATSRMERERDREFIWILP